MVEIITWLEWLHGGGNLAFETLVAIKSAPLLILLGILFFVPDNKITRNRRMFPVRASRTWLALSCLLILADYSDNGYAQHLILANFYCSVVGMVLASRWAAWRIYRDYENQDSRDLAR